MEKGKIFLLFGILVLLVVPFLSAQVEDDEESLISFYLDPVKFIRYLIYPDVYYSPEGCYSDGDCGLNYYCDWDGYGGECVLIESEEVLGGCEGVDEIVEVTCASEELAVFSEKPSWLSPFCWFWVCSEGDGFQSIFGGKNVNVEFPEGSKDNFYLKTTTKTDCETGEVVQISEEVDSCDEEGEHINIMDLPDVEEPEEEVEEASDFEKGLINKWIEGFVWLMNLVRESEERVLDESGEGEIEEPEIFEEPEIVKPIPPRGEPEVVYPEELMEEEEVEPEVVEEPEIEEVEPEVIEPITMDSEDWGAKVDPRVSKSWWGFAYFETMRSQSEVDEIGWRAIPKGLSISEFNVEFKKLARKTESTLSRGISPEQYIDGFVKLVDPNNIEGSTYHLNLAKENLAKGKIYSEFRLDYDPMLKLTSGDMQLAKRMISGVFSGLGVTGTMESGTIITMMTDRTGAPLIQVRLKGESRVRKYQIKDPAEVDLYNRIQRAAHLQRDNFNDRDIPLETYYYGVYKKGL